MHVRFGGLACRVPFCGVFFVSGGRLVRVDLIVF